MSWMKSLQEGKAFISTKDFIVEPVNAMINWKLLLTRFSSRKDFSGKSSREENLQTGEEKQQKHKFWMFMNKIRFRVSHEKLPRLEALKMETVFLSSVSHLDIYGPVLKSPHETSLMDHEWGLSRKTFFIEIRDSREEGTWSNKGSFSHEEKLRALTYSSMISQRNLLIRSQI